MREITILILLNSPFDLQNYKRTGIEFLKKYFQVVVLDCTSWLVTNIDRVDFRQHHYNEIEKVHDKNEFYCLIQKWKPAYAIDYLGNIQHKPAVVKILKESCVKYVVQRLAPIVDLPLQRKIMTSILKEPKKLAERIISKLWCYRTHKNELSPDIAIVAGSKYLDNFTSRAKTIINAGSQDYFTYETCRRSGNKVRVNGGNPFLLFIDDCIAETNDYLLTDRRNKIDVSSYYEALNLFLSNVELVSGLPVVVAAHPNGKAKRDYSKNFGKREVHYGVTAELSEQCNLALTHYSTAISFPVLWRKPIVIITLDALWANMSCSCFINNIIYYLKCPQLSINGDISDIEKVVSKKCQIDIEAYSNFTDQFIKKANVKEEHYYQAFTNYVKRETGELV